MILAHGLLTMTFNPLEKSIPPILAYLLFVKHSWLQVPVTIILAAWFCLCSRSDEFLASNSGELLEKTHFPPLPPGKNTWKLWSGMQQVLPSLVTPTPFYCESISLPFKTQAKIKCTTKSRFCTSHCKTLYKKENGIRLQFLSVLAAPSCPCSLWLWKGEAFQAHPENILPPEQEQHFHTRPWDFLKSLRLDFFWPIHSQTGIELPSGLL